MSELSGGDDRGWRSDRSDGPSSGPESTRWQPDAKVLDREDFPDLADDPAPEPDLDRTQLPDLADEPPPEPDLDRTPQPDAPQPVPQPSPESQVRRESAPEYAPVKETVGPGSRDGPVTVAPAADSTSTDDATADPGAAAGGDAGSRDRAEAVQAALEQVTVAYEHAEGNGARAQDFSGTPATDAPRAVVDPPTDREQQVIDDAKAGLVARQANGDRLGGDPVGRADLWHVQGEGRNERGYESDCALACSAEILQDSGVPASENDVVDYAASNQLCVTGYSDAADNGGSRLDQVEKVLSDHGVASHVEGPREPEQLARLVEDGHGVIQAVNSDILWDGEVNPDSTVSVDGRPAPDHAVVVTGTVRDAQGRLDGFVINDTGNPTGAGVQVDLDRWQESTGSGGCVVTGHPTDLERGARG